MKTITLLNEKGGVGKTTLAVHIAAGLAIRGRRVLLIDADAQANATYLMRLPKKNAGLFGLLVDEDEFGHILYRPEYAAWGGNNKAEGHVMVLPGNVKTRLIPMAIDAQDDLLRERLEELAGRVDVVVIDTPPTPSMLHKFLYAATDYMIYPVECQALAVDGLAKSWKRMEAINEYRARIGTPAMKLLGVQPTKYHVQTNSHNHGLEIISEAFKDKTWPALSLRTIWQDREWARQTLFGYAPDHEATVQAWAMVDQVERGIG